MNYAEVSCTMDSTTEKDFHIIYTYKQRIADNDTINASALRTFQVKLDQLQRRLRKKYGFSEEVMPPDEMLWLSGISYGELERLGCHVRAKATYLRCLLPKRRSERLPRSLVELGYVKLRFVAWRNDKAVPGKVARPIFHDPINEQPFIIVDDRRGYYISDDGELHDACEEGYDYIEQQVLYCFEVHNAKVAEFDGVDPPQPVPRWDPLAQKNGALPARETKPMLVNAHQSNVLASTNPGGFKSLEDQSSVCKKQYTLLNDTTSTSDTALVQSTNSVNDCLDIARDAPWTPTTLLSLSSRNLKIPPKPNAGKALAKWLMDWQEPAQWIFAATDDREPSHAWEVADRLIQAAKPGGPTWYAENFNPNDLTLRHIVGWDKPLLKQGELKLTGANWRKLQKEVEAKCWYPDKPVPYDGPSIFEEQQSYTSIVAAPPPTSGAIEASPPQVAESTIEQPRPLGMPWPVAERVCQDIVAQYPIVVPHTVVLSHDAPEDLFAVSIETGEDQWYDIDRYSVWRKQGKELTTALAQAAQYALHCLEREETSDAVETSPPAPEPVAALPEPDVYEDMAAIEADLRSSASPPLITRLPPLPIVVATPPAMKPLLSLTGGKAGMDPSIAGVLMDRIGKARPGCAMQLKPIGGDRVVIALESSPGRWIDIESSVAWATLSKAVPVTTMNSAAIASQVVT